MGRQCRVVDPETVTIQISGEDWIEVKKRLSYGEFNKMQASLVSEIRQDGRVTPNLENVEIAQVLAYLVDWSLIDSKGKTIPIDTEGRKRAAVESLHKDTVKEIVAAVTAHVEAMEARRSEEKNDQGSAIASL